MKRKIIGLTGIAVVWLLITFYMYLQHDKEDKKTETGEQVLHEPTGEYMVDQSALKDEGSVDRRTLTQSEQELYEKLTNKEVLTHDEAVLLELLNEKFAWMSDSYDGTKERIKQKLEKETDVSRINGWKVEKVDMQTYLVSYTYEKQDKTYGWFLEFKSGGEVIKDVSTDQELMKKYRVAYTDEFKEKLREEKTPKVNISKLEQFKRLQGKGSREILINNEKRILMLQQN
ncbi:MAG: hypothetical protein MRK02_06185 [Candidatus Scalindua sp.]|nr:hypothetical protein [Candidatus Scalindua sp.]